MRLIFGLLLCLNLFAADRVERWGTFEITLAGPASGNPFLDVKLAAQFRFRNRVVEAEGFYDGGGIYRIRFMPDELGDWSYTTTSNVAALNSKTGAFTAGTPSLNNHGPVQVRYDVNAGRLEAGSWYGHPEEG